MCPARNGLFRQGSYVLRDHEALALYFVQLKVLRTKFGAHATPDAIVKVYLNAHGGVTFLPQEGILRHFSQNVKYFLYFREKPYRASSGVTVSRCSPPASWRSVSSERYSGTAFSFGSS